MLNKNKTPATLDTMCLYQYSITYGRYIMKFQLNCKE